MRSEQRRHIAAAVLLLCAMIAETQTHTVTTSVTSTGSPVLQPSKDPNQPERAAVVESSLDPDSRQPLTDGGSGGDECSKEPNRFSWADYLVLGAMLVISCGIGLFYGFVGPKQTTSTDFLLGGSDMGTLPMSLSLTTSFITAIELLGNPSEMYTYGTQYWLIVLAFPIVLPVAGAVFLPVFCRLRLTSCYEYLGLRFDRRLRVLASLMYVAQMILYTSVAVYAPALALSHVTGLNTYIAVTLVYAVCIFYASQGGMKAVIVADSFQTAVLLASLATILILAATGVNADLGSWANVWKSAKDTGRMEFLNIDPRPTTRHTVWSVVLGGSFYWASMFCTNQASVQKYMSVGSLRQAKQALCIACVGLILVFSINFYTGLVMHSHYADCDPLITGEVSASDQLLPLYVMQVMGHLRGIPGLFVAGVFAASLGTVAAALNSLSAVTCEDILVAAWGLRLAPSKGALYAKWLSLGYGLVSFALVFVVERMGGVLQVALSFNGMAGGVTLGLFTLGMCLPRSTARGALWGAVSGLMLVLWLGLGAQIAGEVPQRLEGSAEECPCWNATDTTPATDDVSASSTTSTTSSSSVYNVSYLWYSAIGCLTTVFVGTIISEVSRLIGLDSSDSESGDSVHPDLLSPPAAWFVANKDGSTHQHKMATAPGAGVGAGTQDGGKRQMYGETNLALSLDENPTISRHI